MLPQNLRTIIRNKAGSLLPVLLRTTWSGTLRGVQSFVTERINISHERIELRLQQVDLGQDRRAAAVQLSARLRRG